MDHERARAGFTGYHDGDLEQADRQALEEHLAGCPECRGEWEDYRRTVGEVSGLRVIPPPDDFDRQVAQELMRRNSGRFPVERTFFGIKVALLSFVLLMLLLLVYLVYLMLFAETAIEGKNKGGVSKHTQGSYEVIGPVTIEPQPDTDGEE